MYPAACPFCVYSHALVTKTTNVIFDARTCCPVAAVSVLLLIKFRPFFCLVFILSLSFVSCLCSLSTDLVVWNSTGWISVRFAFNSVFCLFTFFLFLLTLLVWNSTSWISLPVCACYWNDAWQLYKLPKCSKHPMDRCSAKLPSGSFW